MHPYQLPYMEPWGISVVPPAMCNWPLSSYQLMPEDLLCRILPSYYCPPQSPDPQINVVVKTKFSTTKYK